jgi:hypothetical protein
MHMFTSTTLILLALGGCEPLWVKITDDTGDDIPPVDSEGDTDTDADADSDTDADADADADADTDPACDWAWYEDLTVERACASFVGEQPGDWAGAGFASPGDMNGDGIADLVIGASRVSTYVVEGGKVYFVFGRSRGWDLHEPLADSPWMYSDDEQAQAANPVPLGDTNGDGLADVALDPGFSSPGNSELQYVVLGRTGTWPTGVNLDDSDGTLSIPVSTSSLGTPYTGGDFDGDGLNDWYLTDGASGYAKAMTISGGDITSGLVAPDDTTLWVDGSYEGVLFIEPGDYDGDGRTDLMTRWNDWGGFSLLITPETGPPHGVDVTDVVTTHISSSIGATFSGATKVGDVNGDGRDDFAVSTARPEGDPHTGIYLFLGRDSWPATMHETDADVHIAGGQVAHSLTRIGDVNGDGIGDMAFKGPPREGEENADHAYILLGRSTWPAELSLAQVDVHIVPVEPFFEIYHMPLTSMIGDLNGDGLDEVFLRNEYSQWDGLSSAGALNVFVGRTTWPTELTTDDVELRFVGSVQWQDMGSDGTLADLNGDGFDDLVLSSYYHPIGTEEGETFVFFGKPGPSK